MIISTTDKQKLSGLQKAFQKDGHLDNYVKDSAAIIAEKLKERYPGDLLYIDLFRYSFSKNRIVGLPESVLKNYSSEELVENYKLAKKLVNDKKIISFTKLLRRSQAAGLYLTYDKYSITQTSRIIPDIVCFDLNTVEVNNPRILSKKISEMFSEQENAEVVLPSILGFARDLKIQDEKAPLVEKTLLFHKHCYLPFEDLHIYFIGPRTIHKEYDGMLHVCLRKRLKSSYIHELSSFLKDIITETATIKIKKQTQSHEWKKITDEQAHAWKFELGALRTLVDNMHRSFQEKDGVEIFGLHYKYARHHLDNLIRVNEFNLLLMRYGEEGNNREIEKQLLEKMQPIPVSLKQALLAELNTLSDSLPQLEIIGDENQHQVRSMVLVPMEQEINENIPENFYVVVMPTALRIILLDLLKNAVFYRGNQPQNRIYLKEMDENFYSLHISNNYPPSEKLKVLIERKEKAEDIGRFLAGIRTIQRYLFLKYFNKSDNRWELCLAANNDITDIYLKFPKTDITYE